MWCVPVLFLCIAVRYPMIKDLWGEKDNLKHQGIQVSKNMKRGVICCHRGNLQFMRM